MATTIPDPDSDTPSPLPSQREMNKKARAKLAKDTINILIPSLLKSNPRALTGVNSSTLIRYDPSLSTSKTHGPAPAPAQSAAPDAQSQAQSPPQPTAPQPQIDPGRDGSTKFPKIKVIKSDTFDAARSILSSNNIQSRSGRRRAKIAVLNMASPLHPGGGVLNGAKAQEESLCLRSTLYPSLRDEFYRLPDDAAIYSPDVLVFRDSSANGDEMLDKKDWFFVNVISAGAVRFPELATGDDGVEEERYAADKDREAMLVKARLVFQVARQMQVSHLVLSAWGCGAYGNPVGEVAGVFRRVILGKVKRGKGREGNQGGIRVAETGIEEVVFAILDKRGENLRVFEEAFADVMVSEDEG